MTERILTLHPAGKAGVNIERQKYEDVRAAILTAIGAAGELEFRALAGRVRARLPEFAGSPGWYTTTVKLDLEARGLIECVPGRGPQRLRLTKPAARSRHTQRSKAREAGSPSANQQLDLKLSIHV